ncbi:MAG TPA: substrate-binding domain-containing protein [Gaiellales bacterium]|jgi:ABC-type phosphate transport system substrate-binding protein
MRRRRLLVVAPLAAGIFIALASNAIAGRHGVRDSVYGVGAVTVHPSTGLGDNQFVKITWRHVVPNQVVFFRQCTAHPTKVARDCTAIYSDPGFTNGHGSGTLYQHVSEGEVRSESGSTFHCDISRPCTLGVFSGSSLHPGILRPLHFARTPSGCPKPRGAALSGGGANQANHAMFDWGVQICQPPARLGVNYIPANSPDGMDNFVKGLNDFAVTGEPFSADQLSQLQSAGKSFSYAPVTASALVVAYKIFDQDPEHAAPGSQVTNLKLTPELVAKIFTGQISNWHTDPEINALNPGHVFPPLVRPLVRGDHSVANLEFTSWLSAEGGAGLPSDWPGAGTDYPLNYVTQNAGIVGGDALADAIADPVTVQNNNDYFSDGYIGFVDSSEAAYYGLPVARIQNAAGKFVKATPAAITAALHHAAKGSDGLLEPDYATKDPKAYPMPFVSYLTAPTSGISDATGTTLRGFLHYAVTAGRTRIPGGYLPLPKSLVAATEGIVDQIPGTTPVVGGGGGTGPGGGTDGGGAPYTGGITPPDLGTAPPPDPGDAPGGGKGAGGSSNGTATGLPSATLAASAGRLVLPSLIAIGGLGLIGGLMLLGASGTGGGGLAGTVRHAAGFWRWAR